MSDEKPTLDDLAEKVDSLATALNGALQEITQLKKSHEHLGKGLKSNVEATGLIIIALGGHKAGED